MRHPPASQESGFAVDGYAKHAWSIALARQIVDRIADLPGVKSVHLERATSRMGRNNLVPRGWASFHGEHKEVVNRVISAGYFATLEARLWRGRYFDEAEDESKRPVRQCFAIPASWPAAFPRAVLRR